jgi:peptidoglycan/xylan/chitin deacetylase (PgdA/CDA1 family)
MSHYKVTHQPSAGFARPHVALALFVLLLALLGLPAYTTISVTVDGERYRVERGSTASDIVAQAILLEGPGDLLDMTGGIVVSAGGTPPKVVRYGEELALDERIHNGDVLRSLRGDDVVEAQVATATPIPVTVEYRGDGPMEAVASQGTPGMEVQGIGTVSGLVTPLGEWRPAQPTIVERTYPVAGDKVVALTFDDGPWPGQTERILDILEAEGVTATFFVLGARAQQHPQLTARIAEEGHQVASHGYSHSYLASNDKALARREIGKAKYQIARATGEYPTWFRAPGGVLSDVARDEVRAAEQRIVRWDVDPQDWRKVPAWKLARITIAEVRPGSVVLLHDGGGDRTMTIKALTTIIRKLQDQGYTFVTLDQMGSASRS